jgi:hypothetical protein
MNGTKRTYTIATDVIEKFEAVVPRGSRNTTIVSLVEAWLDEEDVKTKQPIDEHDEKCAQ